MFVASDATLPSPMLESLKSFEESSGKPLRVLYGRFRAMVPEPWTAEQAEACSTDLENVQENGITIVNWGSAASQDGREWTQLPGDCYVDSTPRDLEIRDVIVPQAGGPRQAIGYFIDDSHEIAEFKDNTVWFFVNLQYLPEPEKLDLDKFLIEPLRRSSDKESMAEFLAEIADKAANAFATMMNSNPDRRVQRMRQQIEEFEAELRSAEAQVLTHTAELTHRKREFDAIAAQTTMPEDHWKKEWRHLAEHPLIVPGSLGMNEMTVSYDTVLLNISLASGGELPLGRFRITINMDTGVVRLNNLNNRRHARDHPHVSHGDPCWGGYHGEVQDHIQSKRLSALVEFIFGYLRSYNPDDDWGHYIDYWTESPDLIAA